MSGDKERKLNVEDLENRVAPGLVYVPPDPLPGDPPDPSSTNTSNPGDPGWRKHHPKSNPRSGKVSGL